MKIIAPDYYNNFKCLAHKCRHNCCIGWEIDIDIDTIQKYKDVTGDFSKRLKAGISNDGGWHFKLDHSERCPFLNDCNLCDIILELGEDMLCQICTDHPRFRNVFDNREEIGLGLCCEAAAKLILSKSDKTILNEDYDDNFFKFRNKIFELLQDRTKHIDTRVRNMLEYCKIPSPIECGTDWKGLLHRLERLNEHWQDYINRIDFNKEYYNTLDTAYEQLLVYFIYRHLAGALTDGKMNERIGFAALSFYIIRAMNISGSLDELIDICVMYSSEIEYSDVNINTILDII